MLWWPGCGWVVELTAQVGSPREGRGRGRLTWSGEGRARMPRKATHCTRTWERCKALRAADDSEDAGLVEGVWKWTGLKWLRRGKGSEETLRCAAARDLAVKRSLHPSQRPHMVILANFQRSSGLRTCSDVVNNFRQTSLATIIS